MPIPSIQLRPTWSNSSNSVLNNFQRCAGRPSARWGAFCLAFFFSLWLFAPLLHLDHLRLLSSLTAGPRKDGHTKPFIQNPSSSPSTLWSSRADHVREAFLHAYSGYTEHAAPFDELLPVTGGKVNNFNGWSVSIVDSLDTMWIMGLREQFLETIPIIAKSTFFLDKNHYAPFFETVIRYLGGLLSAYALSGEPILLTRADDLGRMLLPAFNTTSGLPMYAVNTQTGETRSGWNTGVALLAEASSCQMEYKYLAHLTGRPEYFLTVEKIMQIMETTDIPDGFGLMPTLWDIVEGKPMNAQYSVGAFGDSAHEYLLKQWLLTSKSEPRPKDLYLHAAKAIITKLLYITPKRKLLYVTDLNQGSPSHIFEHLSCFLPGLLALAAQTLSLSSRDKQLHQWAAKGLAYACWMTYADHPTGLGPDEMQMEAWPGDTNAGRWIEHVENWEKAGSVGEPPGLQEVPAEEKGSRDYESRKPGYLLRPETLESFYILYKTTGDEVWRERGWTIFESIQKETRTKYGYTSINQVETSPSDLKNEMPSYFLAETLKYLYLLFTDAELIPLDKWVFNTEAHPLPIFSWSSWEKREYGLA